MTGKQNFSCDPKNWAKEYSDEFFRFAMYRVNNREAAEDLVQDTFYYALKSLDKFRRDCPEKSWLYNILKNKIVDYYRKKTNQEVKRSSSPIESDEAFYNQFFNKSGKNVNGWSENAMPQSLDLPADSIMENKELMKFILLCISLLPETWGKVFSLKNIEELGTKEICKELDITPSNLWTIIHRAKLQLRSCIEKKTKQ